MKGSYILILSGVIFLAISSGGESSTTTPSQSSPSGVECYVCNDTNTKKDNHCRRLSKRRHATLRKCPQGCLAAVGRFTNNDTSFERSCLNSEVISLFGEGRQKRGSGFRCDSIFFEDVPQVAGKRYAKSYEYCQCSTDKCNGREINKAISRGGVLNRMNTWAMMLIVAAGLNYSFLGRKGRGLMFIGVGVITFAILMGIPVVSAQPDKDALENLKCIYCTEKTHNNSRCARGEGEEMSCEYTNVTKEKYRRCVKVAGCISGLSCQLWRGCSNPGAEDCLAAGGITFERDENKCGETRLKLSTNEGSMTALCFIYLKTITERIYAAGLEAQAAAAMPPEAENAGTGRRRREAVDVTLESNDRSLAPSGFSSMFGGWPKSRVKRHGDEGHEDDEGHSHDDFDKLARLPKTHPDKGEILLSYCACSSNLCNRVGRTFGGQGLWALVATVVTLMQLSF